MSYAYFKICETFKISIEELSKFPNYKIEWMLLNIIESEKRKQEEFKIKFEMVKPFLDIELYKAEQKMQKQEEHKIISASFDDDLLKYEYAPLDSIDKNIVSIQQDNVKIENEKINKIKEVLGEEV